MTLVPRHFQEKAAPVTGPDLSLSRSCWPTEQERLLLRAGLAEPAQAVSAWQDYCAQVDIEHLNEGCYRLFPLVAARLSGCEKIPHQGLIFGLLRHTWVRNQRFFRAMAPLLQAMHRAGVEILLLKGAALQGIYRQRGSVRGLADLDILIHPEDLEKAIQVAQNNHGIIDPGLTPERVLELLRYRHELTVKNSAGQSLDIHWYLFSDYRHLGAEDSFWHHSVPCPLGEVPTRALSRTDQLLHACLHGVQWNEVSPIRWLADAALLIQEGKVDWVRLETQARRLECVSPVRETLLFLEQLELPLPGPILDHWRALELSPLEKREGGYRAHLPCTAERTRQLAWIYYRLNRSHSPRQFITGIPAYMRQLHHFRAYARCLAFFYHLLLLCRPHPRRGTP